MNRSQIEAQRRQIDAEATEIDYLVARAVATKSFGQINSLEVRVNKLAEMRKNLVRKAANLDASEVAQRI